MLTLPVEFQSRAVYHFTPLENVASIMEKGLLSVSAQASIGLTVTQITSDAATIEKNDQPIACTPYGKISDYVPFFFCKRSPLLLSIISNKAIDEQLIVYFEFPFDKLCQIPFVFTNAAVISHAIPDFFNNLDDLSRLNWNTIDSNNNHNSLDKMAELFVMESVPIHLASRVIVWDNLIRKQIEDWALKMNVVLPKLETDASFYFMDDFSPTRTPRVNGPTMIHDAYQKSLQQIMLKIGNKHDARLKNLEELASMLDENFASLPETAELVGLLTDNRAHFEDVGNHTLRVVHELMETEEYQQMSSHDQVILKIAALLHDIGKGPKNRWEKFGGKQQIDHNHPIRALPMLERILTQEILSISLDDANLILKLVAYHDIIGALLAGNRKIKELLTVFTTHREIDMLCALGRADSKAITPSWERPEERKKLQHKLHQAINKPEITN